MSILPSVGEEEDWKRCGEAWFSLGGCAMAWAGISLHDSKGRGRRQHQGPGQHGLDDQLARVGWDSLVAGSEDVYQGCL